MTQINLDDLTMGQAKTLAAMFQGQPSGPEHTTLNAMIGKQVIVRTYSAGVWFGTLEQKAGKEVIIRNARRMWRWFAAESISLSAVALYGIQQGKSKIAPPVDSVWVEAIELIPCTNIAITSLEDAPNVEAE